MHRYLLAYLGFVDDIILSENPDDIDAILEEHLRQTDFMKHERLIHLIVTVLFAILLFICIGILAVTDKIIFALLTVMILCLLIPYIYHYYFLENSVQKMYRQYNTMCSMTGRRKLPDECLLTKNTAGRGKKK